MNQHPFAATFQDERTAWRIVLISAFALFMIFGIRLSFSVFFAEFIQAEGWSNEAAASIFSVSMIAFALGSTPSGILLDRFGPQVTFTGGVLLLATALFLSSQAQSIEQLIIAYGGIGGIGISIVGLGPIAANIAGWVPTHRRGIAIGTAFAGTGIGSLVFVPLATWLIDVFEWRTAYLILALACVFVLVPLMAFGQKRPIMIKRETTLKDTGRTSWRSLFRNPIFWVLMLVSLTAMGPVRGLTVHQIAYMESVQIERPIAAGFVGLSGFLSAGMFIGWGYISDRFGRVWAFGLGGMSLIAAVGVLIVLQQNNVTVLLLLYSILLALGEGSRSSQTTALASDLFQQQGLGFVNGMVGTMFGLGAAFAPWLIGRLRDNTTSYMPGLTAIIVITIISIIAFVIAAQSKTKRDATV